MINIQKFVKIRKSLGLSQTQLCEGICTQATLSKFENLGRVPSMKILTQLCDRMGISLSDLIDENQSSPLKVEQLFDQADFHLITFNYAEIQQILNQIKVDQLNQEENWHYLYLKGIIAVLRDQNYIDGLYYFNQILTDPESNPQNIYYLLAATGCGEVYVQQNDFSKAAVYFNTVFDEIMTFKIKDNQTAIKALSILFNGGVFFSKQDDLKISDALLKYAYKICMDNHHTYYLARILYQIALNNIKENADADIVLENLADANAFAKFNRNLQLIKDIEHTKQEFLDNNHVS